MGKWADFPLPDGSYADPSKPWADQDVCNFLPTPAEAEGTRTRIKYPVVPGLQAFAGVGTGPHRGARDVEGQLFVVSGTTLYRVSAIGEPTSLGTIPGVGLVSMAHNQIANGNQLLIGTDDNSYIWNTVTSVLTPTGVPLQSVDFLNQRFLGIDPQRRFWRYSGLADGLSWNTLDNESAESSPDRIVGGIVSQGEWLVFGERTIEVWQNEPNATGTTAFQRSVVIERGCANADTLRRADNSVFFVDNNGIPCRLQGYTPAPVAPKAIIDDITQSDRNGLFAWVWEDRGYVVYYVTARDGKTWGFDVTTQKWHRRQSYGLTRWRVNTLCKWNNGWYAGDYSSNKLYRLAWGYAYEGCELMPRSMRTGVLHSTGNRVRVHGFKLLADTGNLASATPAANVSGNLPDGYVGDAVSYQYTLLPIAHAGQTLTTTITSGALPAGLAMSTAGLVTGTRGAEGTYTFTQTATNDCGTSTLTDTSITSRLTLGWVDSLTGTAQTNFDIDTGNGVYMAAGWNDNLRRSADGATWAGVPYTASTGWDVGAAIANIWHHSGDIWYMAISNSIARSLDAGLTWALVTAPRYALKDRSVSDVGGVWWAGTTAVGNTRLFQPLSADAATDIVYGADHGKATRIAYLGGRYLVGTDTGKILSGTTLANAALVYTDASARPIVSFAYLSGVWLANPSGGIYLRSTDTLTWNIVNSGTICEVASAAGYFYRSTYETVDRSIDGTGWTTVDSYFTGIGGGSGSLLATDGRRVFATTDASSSGSRAAIGT